MQPTVAVFVSSTWFDLEPERRSVETAIHRLRATKFIGMEYFGSRSETTTGASLAEVDGSQVYVGIFGQRYGSGITEQEYRRAIARGLKCFVYFREDTADAGTQQDAGDADAAKLSALKAELRARHTVSSFTGPCELAAKVTADLHRWLFDEYLGPRLEPLLHAGSDASNAAGLLSAVRQLRALNATLLARLETAGWIDTELSQAYLDPTPVFERVELDRFEGRGWLREQIDAFVRRHERGCFVLEADAGLGKTSFLAHYAQVTDCVHHFVELAPGMDGVVPALRNLAAQFLQRWRLTMDPAWSAAQSVQRRDFLQTLLQRVVARRDETAPGTKLVVVIDALDEAGTPRGQNVLGLPRVLPEGVFLVVSQRPVDVALAVEGPRQVVRIEAEDQRNLEDAARFIRASLRPLGVDDEASDALLARSNGNWVYLHHLLAEIRSGDRSPNDLDSLPRGLWQYYAQYWLAWREQHRDAWESVHLPVLVTLGAVRGGATIERLARLAGVPVAGLGELLDRHWSPFLARRGQEQARYALYHASLREFLEGHVDPAELTRQEQVFASGLEAAMRRAHGAIADHYVAGWGGVAQGLPGLQDPARRDCDEGYGLRHLIEHLQLGQRVDELHEVCGLERRQVESLPYRRAGLGELIDRLLGRSRVHRFVRYENVWFAAHEEAGELEAYLADVERALRNASVRTSGAAEKGSASSSVHLEIRYALIKTSVHSTAATLPPGLLDALVFRKVWPVSHALHYARRVPGPRQRAGALTCLLRHLPGERRAGVVREAYRAAQAIDSTGERMQALLPLLAHSTGPLLDEALELAIATAVTLPGLEQALAVAGIAPHLTPHACRRAMQAILGLEYVQCRFDLMEALAAHASEPCRRRARRGFEALLTRSLREADDVRRHYYLFAAAAGYRQGDERRAMIVKSLHGLDAAEAEYPLDYRHPGRDIACLVRLAEATGGAEREALLRRAVDATLGLRVPKNQSIALQVLAPNLGAPLLGRVVDAVLREKQSAIAQVNAEGLREIAVRCAQLGLYEQAFRLLRKLDYERGRTLCALAPFLPAAWLQKALRLADKLGGEVRWRSYNEPGAGPLDWARERLPAMCGLAARQAELGQISEAMLTVRSLAVGAVYPEWSKLLEGVAPHLDGQSLRTLLSLARVIDDSEDLTLTLAHFAPDLPEDRVRLLLARARRIGIDHTYRSYGGTSSSSIGMEKRSEALAPLGLRLAALGFEQEALGILSRSMRDEMIVYRTRALMHLAPALGEAGLAQLVAASARLDPLTRAAERHYTILGPHLPALSLNKLLERARAVPDTDWVPRMLLLGQLAPHLAVEEGEKAAREALTSWTEHGKEMAADYRDRTLGELFPALIILIPDEAREALFARVAEIGDDAASALRLAERVLPHLSERDTEELLGSLSRHHGEACLRLLVRHLPKTMLLATLEAAGEELDTVAQGQAAVRLAELGDVERALSALDRLSPDNQRAAAARQVCLAIPPSETAGLARAWERCLPAADGTRADLLSDLRALAPVVLRIGGEGVAARVMDVCDGIHRCWP